MIMMIAFICIYQAQGGQFSCCRHVLLQGLSTNGEKVAHSYHCSKNECRGRKMKSGFRCATKGKIKIR